MADKKILFLPIIIGYCFTGILLVADILSLFPIVLTTEFNCHINEDLFILYNWLDNSFGEELATLIFLMALPWLCFILVGIYHFVSHKICKFLPSKITLFSWILFLVYFVWLYASDFLHIPGASVFNDTWLSFVTLILFLMFLFNTVDFVRLIQSVKRESTNK